MDQDIWNKMAGARPVYILNRGGEIQFDLFKNTSLQ